MLEINDQQKAKFDNSRLTRPDPVILEREQVCCPVLLEENIQRIQRWGKDGNTAFQIDARKSSIVNKEHCQSYCQGSGCKKMEACWKDD